MFLKEDTHRFIFNTELFLSDNRGLRYTGFKKINFFVGHPVAFKLISFFTKVLKGGLFNPNQTVGGEI